MKRLIFLASFTLCCMAKPCLAQHVRGHWYGIGKLQVSQTFQDYLSELTLRQNGRTVAGSFQYYFKDSLVTAAVSGSFDPDTRKLLLKPFKMIYYLSPTAQNSIDCFMSGRFDLVVSKTESVLSGQLMSDADHKYTVPNISFRLVRSNDTLDRVRNEEPEAAPVAATTTAVAETVPAAAPVSTAEALSNEAYNGREKVYAKEIEVSEKKLRIEIYDNGQVDYDSVSLFLNGKLVLPKSKLDHRAIRFTIEIDPSLSFNELSMVAENLGMIPPNTAALVVYDGRNRHEVQLSSDLSKTATIKLVSKKTGSQ